MELLPKQPSTKGPAQMFTGDVWFDVTARGEAPSRVRVNTVRFAPCARTAWHSHSLGQTLHVTDGVGWIQSRGGEVLIIRPGDVIYTPPGEELAWCGAGRLHGAHRHLGGRRRHVGRPRHRRGVRHGLSRCDAAVTGT